MSHTAAYYELHETFIRTSCSVAGAFQAFPVQGSTEVVVRAGLVSAKIHTRDGDNTADGESRTELPSRT